jgi:hypothetical protein
MKIQ